MNKIVPVSNKLNLPNNKEKIDQDRRPRTMSLFQS